MTAQDERPIIIGGIGRSGSTFLQWALSQHPDVTIFGQVDAIRLANVRDLQTTLEAALRAIHESNAKPRFRGYEVPHYAGCAVADCGVAVAELVKTLICGRAHDKARWGLKLISTSANIWDKWFPTAQWIVCIRNPFSVYESGRNCNFIPKSMGLDVWLPKWLNAPKLAASRPCFVWQIDKMKAMPEEGRAKVMRELLAFLDLSPAPEVLDYARRLPVVHKVVADNERRFRVTPAERKLQLAAIPGLAEAIEKHGCS